MKYFATIISAMAFALSANAQNIIVRDGTGTIVNGDTIEISPESIQKPPYTTIECKLYAQNNTGSNIDLGAKKAEHSTDADAYHAICFETQCFTPSVYVAPVTVPLSPSRTDSSFKGAYRYIVGSHVAGKHLVSYTFFNSNNPADSAIVYVLYNTIPSTTGINSTTLQNNIGIYPNPARDIVNISAPVGINGTLIITNSTGTVVHRQLLADTRNASKRTDSWAAGMYYYNIENTREKITGRFVVE